MSCHVMDILSTVGDVQYHGGYLEYHRGAQYRGGIYTMGVILSVGFKLVSNSG